jgi:hypothetical protein
MGDSFESEAFSIDLDKDDIEHGKEMEHEGEMQKMKTDIEILASQMEIPEGKTSQCCTIKQNHKYKIYWDIFIIVLLLFVCVVIPFRIAFVKEQESNWTMCFNIIDGFFLLDMVLTFFTSVSDEQKMTEISDKKVIAKRYFEFWFWVDIVSIFPFDQFS